MGKVLRSVRTFLLTTVGRSGLARLIVGRRCQRYGVALAFREGALLLTSKDRLIRIHPKHLPFAPGIARRFDAYFSARPPTESDPLATADYSSPPDLLTLRRVEGAGVSLRYTDGVFWLQKNDCVMLLQRRHFIYAADMAERFDLYFSSVVPFERDGLLLVDYSRPGLLQTYRRSGLQFQLASFPEEEEAIEGYLRWYRPKPGDTVFDLGAHCGVSTCMLAEMVGPQGRVVAFEPDPLNFGLLVRNLERHGHTNVTALNIAVSSKSGTVQFNCEGTIGSGLVSLMERDSVGSTIDVATVTLAEAFERWGTPAFCKMDIEGAEIEVLASSKEVLIVHQTHLALDTNHFVNGVLTSSAVEHMLRTYGYDTATESKPLATTWASPKQHALAAHS